MRSFFSHPARFVEALESRRLMSGGSSRVFSITGASTPVDVLSVELKSDGIHWTDNGESHFCRYQRGLKEVDIYAGVFPGDNSLGDHTVNLEVDCTSAGIVNVWGTNKSVNHLNANVFSSVLVSMTGGNQSLNYLNGNVTARRGSLTLRGGDYSTNNICWASGSNYVYGGYSSDNEYTLNTTNSCGILSAGANSSNNLFTPDHQAPSRYRIFGTVQIQ